jgi:type IV secretion system protein VirB4
MVQALEALDLDFRWCTRWLGMEKAAQRALLRRVQGAWVHHERSLLTRMAESISGAPARIVDSDATRKAEEADAARQELGADIVAYGDFTSTVTVWDTDANVAEDKLRDVMHAFEAQGFTVTAERVHAEQAWLSSHPGNRRSSARRTKQHTLTLAHLLPGLAAAWPGPQEDAYLQGPPWFLAHTETSTALRLVNHVRDVGHFLIFGATGLGKSTLVGFLVAQWFARYRGVQCFWFDMDRSARLLTLLLGGTWYELGVPGLAFQPLRHVDDLTARGVALQWLLDRVEEAGQAATGEVVGYLSSTLVKLAQEPVRQRTLSTLVTIMAAQSREVDLRAHAGRIGADGMSRPDQRLEGLVATHHAVRLALKPYTTEGEYGWLFDAEHDDLAQGPLHTFEQRTLYALKRLVKPVTSYVFQQVEQRFSTDIPTLLPMDEAAITAALPAYADTYDEWLMTTRKKSVSLGFLINALHQITDEGTALSALGRMLQVNCPSRYFLPNTEAMAPAMRLVYGHFGLTETEMQMLATARGAHDVYYSCRELGKRLFHLPLSSFILDCVARNTEADHALMDRLLAQEGREGFARAWFAHHGYHDAALAVERTDDVPTLGTAAG